MSGINPSAINEAKSLQTDAEHQVETNARDRPFNRPGDTNISGYNTTLETRRDLRDEVSTGSYGQSVAYGRQSVANRSRVEAVQGLQRLGDMSTLLPDDFRFYLNSEIVGTDGIVPNIGKALVGSDHPFWEYAAKKEALILQEDYEMFKLSQIDLTTPEARQFWETRHPQLTNKLREGLRKQRLERAKLEDIGAFGVQSEKDLWLLYKKERGFDNGILGLGMPYLYGGVKERPLGFDNSGTDVEGQRTYGFFSIPEGNGRNVAISASIKGTVDVPRVRGEGGWAARNNLPINNNPFRGLMDVFNTGFMGSSVPGRNLNSL